MTFFERKWVLPVIVLIVIIGFNGISGWIDGRGEKILSTAPSSPEAATEIPAPAPDEKPVTVTVHVCGAVKHPGIYTLPEGSRINDALEKAGGFLTQADPVSVNLAEVITDGQQILIYEKNSASLASGSPGGAQTKPAGMALPVSALPVSINHGSLEALMLLDGIGEKTAQKIMDYRRAQGGFKSIEELKNVPGIGDKKFEQIKNDVKL